MRILALDLATHCGFSHSCGESGCFDLSIKKDESSGMRLIRFRGKLNEMKSAVGVDLVVYETALQMPGVRAGFAVASELQGVLKVWCEDNRVDFKPYSPTAIKKHATGKGNANKAKMIEAAQKKWRRVFTDDNEVDARFLLDLAKKDLGL